MDESLITLNGVVERVTFHSPQTGWSVLKVSQLRQPKPLITVTVHQAKVFAGSTMEFKGVWVNHPKFGEQFKAQSVIEKKPSSIAALEKYLGSGLIKGVGPKTAKKIVHYFKDKTLEIFEENIEALANVNGIAEKKLGQIKDAWLKHRAVRDVMLFLQEYGISTLFAVKIFKVYGENAIAIVSSNPYRLAHDIYGIGFFSADKIALAMGFKEHSDFRICAAITHALAASREEGHCFLTDEQIIKKVEMLLGIPCSEIIQKNLKALVQENEIRIRNLKDETKTYQAYYSKSLYFDEEYIAKKVLSLSQNCPSVDLLRAQAWIDKYLNKNGFKLSLQQKKAVLKIIDSGFSILTGGPGCGKTTTTRVLVKLLCAMKKRVMLAAPTGRAAQRMSEVIGLRAKTIHRLLEVDPKNMGFKKCQDDPLRLDWLIVDECSMLDTNLAAALLKAVPKEAQVLFIGDPDQLPSVGAGNVLGDLINSPKVLTCSLTQVFRQASESMIVRSAHQINKGHIPLIDSPLRPYGPSFKDALDLLFIDAEEATKEQVNFITKAQRVIEETLISGHEQIIKSGEDKFDILRKDGDGVLLEKLMAPDILRDEEKLLPSLNIPPKFLHVDLQKFIRKKGYVDQFKSILKAVHPWSSLNFGMTAADVILRLIKNTIPRVFGENAEVQVLSPQVRGSLGTNALNVCIQHQINEARPGLREIKMGEKIFRHGDRVIQTRNNYEKGVFNGDIGKIVEIDLESYQCSIRFGQQAPVIYEKNELVEVSLAYAITIHKSQGSEFDIVIIPLATQHFKMLFRNLIYTGITRAKKMCVLVGSRRALALSIKQVSANKRQTALQELMLGTHTS